MGLLWGAVVCVLVAWVMGCSGPHATPSEQHGERGVAAFAALDKLSARQPNLVAIALPRPASRPAFTRDPGGGFVSEGWRAASEQRVDGLGAHLPPAADGVMSVGASRFDALHVRVRLEGARAESTAHLTEGRVVYEGALAGTDRVLASDGSSLEEFLVLRDARAPRAFVWNLQLPDPAPGSLVRVTEHDGAFRFENARGEPKLVMSAPVAYDAQGERVDLAVAWNAAAHTLRVTLPVNRELAFPVVVDPKYDLSVWFDTGTRLPAARNLHTMVFDSARNEVVLFGGFNQAQLNDTWVWSGASSTWTHRFPAVKPPARSFHVMAFDSVRGEVVLFGGVGTNGYLGDTWVWNGAAQTWTQRSPAVSPPARTSAALAFDSTRGEALLFGGANGALLNDTWGWNGTNWAQHMSATTPTARGNHALAFDSGRGEVVMFGGQVGNPPSTAVNETWVWNGTTWTRRNVTAPPARANHVLAFDAARGEVMLFGGLSTSTTAYNDTWAWNGATQTWVGRMPATSPGARQAHAGAFDTTRGELVTFGGLVGVGANAYGRDTWAWSSALQTWAKKSPLASPSARYGHTLVFDSNRKEVLLFGGWSGASSNETWVWNGATQSWAQRTPAVSPPPRFAHAVAFDSARNEVVLFGGFGYWDDTWVWDGTAQTWTARAPPSRPRGRDAHAMVFDSARGEVVLFGGYSSAGYENDTWVWNGAAQTWTQRLPSMPPAGRGGHALIYDPARQETVLFAGIVNGSRVNDTWVWNGTAQTWTQRTPAASPPARGDHRLAFDLARQETVMFGGSALTPFNDTWVWSGSTWTQRAAAAPPSAREGLAMVYDGVNGEVVLFGGLDSFGTSLGDTWIHRTLGGTCATNAECVDTAFCTDGVCCNASACDACETCGGTSPGRCTPVLNTEDADTCAKSSGKSCSNLGECKAALGLPAATASACASGFLVDGVCCDTPSCPDCQTCDASKTDRGLNAGHCDYVRTGSDPYDQCADDGPATCQHDGTCDGHGSCRTYAKNTPCGNNVCTRNAASGQFCTGGGECSPAEDAVDCGAFACHGGACPTSCGATADCAALNHCESGTCLPDRGAICDGDHTVTAATGSTKDCAPYRCVGATCRADCASKSDCTGDADCTHEGKCVAFTAAPSEGGGCGMARSAGEGSRGGLAVAALLAFIALRKAIARSAASAAASCRVSSE